MSTTVRKRAGYAGLALGAGLMLALSASPAEAQVNLGTAGSFVVLGGSTVTNTGPSVLHGDLGVSPGTSLVGFGLPATVLGATHANDAVAAQAQLDLTTAYTVAAGQPVAPANDLTGTNLGNRTLNSGNYRYASSAQLTGALTLDAQGDPNAEFVFEIGSTLTTAGASSVVLVNGASPCNVYWQVGSSATLDTTTAFQGNVMALSDISLNNGASVQGRVLARNGQISLINNVLDASLCAAGSSTTPGGATTPPATGGTTGTPPASPAPPAASGSAGTGTSAGSSTAGPAAIRRGTATLRHGTRSVCSKGFAVSVRGHRIKRVVFSLDSRRIASVAKSPFKAYVLAPAGRHSVTARVTFTDATRTKVVRMRYRVCAAAALQPVPGPSAYTG
jgi:hypothetical protein